MADGTETVAEKACPECGKTFKPGHGSQKFCTNRKDGPGNCQKTAERRREKARGYERPKVQLKCHGCAKLFMGRPDKRVKGSREHYYCTHACYSAHRRWKHRKYFSTTVRWETCSCCQLRWINNPQSTLSKCPRCNVKPSGPHSPWRPPGGARHWIVGNCQRCSCKIIKYSFTERLEPYCSPCMRSLAKERRRAHLAGVPRETYNRLKVFERDNWRCQLCGKKTRPDKKTPHHRAPTIDHIVPISKGGADVESNVQTACFVCNSKKAAGGRPGGEQLRLSV